MTIQNLGNLSGTTPLPVSVPGNTARAATQRTADALPQAAEQPSRERVEKSVDEMRSAVSDSASNNLQFSIDSDTGQTIVRVTDMQTGELIRQIPSEELVELAKSLDRMQGKLLRQQV